MSSENQIMLISRIQKEWLSGLNFKLNGFKFNVMSFLMREQEAKPAPVVRYGRHRVQSAIRVAIRFYASNLENEIEERPANAEEGCASRLQRGGKDDQ